MNKLLRGQSLVQKLNFYLKLIGNSTKLIADEFHVYSYVKLTGELKDTCLN